MPDPILLVFLYCLVGAFLAFSASPWIESNEDALCILILAVFWLPILVIGSVVILFLEFIYPTVCFFCERIWKTLNRKS